MLPPFPLKILFAAAAETALNALLQRDPHADMRQRPLNGKVLAIEIRGWDRFWLHFSPDAVSLLADYEAQADAGIALDLDALPRLQQRDQLTTLIREGRVDLSGDPALFNVLAILLGDMQIDWEGELARYSGDVLAHVLFREARRLHGIGCRELERNRQDLAEYLVEEIRLAPGALEVAYFCEEVDVIKRDIDVIALRLERLRHKVGL